MLGGSVSNGFTNPGTAKRQALLNRSRMRVALMFLVSWRLAHAITQCSLRSSMSLRLISRPLTASDPDCW